MDAGSKNDKTMNKVRMVWCGIDILKFNLPLPFVYYIILCKLYFFGYMFIWVIIYDICCTILQERSKTIDCWHYWIYVTQGSILNVFVVITINFTMTGFVYIYLCMFSRFQTEWTDLEVFYVHNTMIQIMIKVMGKNWLLKIN